MHKAAQGGHLEVIKFLSQPFGARICDRDNNDDTILHWTAYTGHYKVARYLIKELKMDPQDRDKVCGVAWKGRPMCNMSNVKYLCVLIIILCDIHVATQSIFSHRYPHSSMHLNLDRNKLPGLCSHQCSHLFYA